MWGRRLAAAAVVVVAALALYRLVWIPYRCNIVHGHVGRITEGIWEQPDSFRTRELAAANTRRLAKCLEHSKTNYALMMTAASNYVLGGRNEAAIVTYQRALAVNPRPELHAALGHALIESGDREGALKNFIYAGEFSGLPVLTDIPDAEIRWKAHRIVGDRIEKAMAARGTLDMTNLLANAGFETPGAATTTQATKNGASPAAAHLWHAWGANGASVSTALETKVKRAGNYAMRVVTNMPESGLRAWLPELNRKPRVITSAWVYVVRGRVAMGSGDGTPPMNNAVSKTTGRWERLEGANDTCPANTTVFYAADAGGAEFYVDEVHVRETFAAPPCER